jgi:LPS sulfotransferase NodH
LRKFVVVGVQRSGTTLVTTSLDSHPAIHCAGELFKMHRPRGDVQVNDSGYRAHLDSSFKLKLTDCISRRRIVHRFLDRFYEQGRYEAIGFKLMSNQTRRGKFHMVVPYLIDNQASVIHVIRENSFKTYLSRLVAQHRRVFHATQHVGELPRLNVPTGDLIRKLSSIETQGERLQETFDGRVPYLASSYEGYVADPRTAGQKLLSFLAVSRADLKSPLVKVSSDDLSKIVANLDEVKRVLRSTRYEKWVL